MLPHVHVWWLHVLLNHCTLTVLQVECSGFCCHTLFGTALFIGYARLNYLYYIIKVHCYKILIHTRGALAR